MPLVGVPCGLDVPGLAWVMAPAPGGAGPVRVRPRAAPHLCAAQGTANGSLELAPCSAAADAAQDWNYTQLSGAVVLAAAPAVKPGRVDPWERFTPGQARAALPRSWDVLKPPPRRKIDTVCMLNRQRELTLPHPTAAPTATSSTYI